MNYYLDESGTTGDLISKKFDLGFFKQPLFTHACVSCKDEVEVSKFISQLKKKYEINERELKSEDLYFKKPEAILEIVKYIHKSGIVYLCEIMDKKYNIAVSIVNHLLTPPLSTLNTEKFDGIRMDLYNYVSIYAPDELYLKFRELCLNPREDTLFETFHSIRTFFNSQKPKYSSISFVNKNIKEKN